MKRDWAAAREKCDREGRCRACGRPNPEAAHLWPRSMGGGQDPDLILPLCRGCHELFDAHRLEVLGLLSLDEQLALVRAAKGIELARQRAVPNQSHRRVA